jgi:hypothetical protein
MITTFSPCASAIPVRIATPLPRLDLCWTSLTGYRSATSAVSSVEPSSTTSTS